MNANKRKFKKQIIVFIGVYSRSFAENKYYLYCPAKDKNSLIINIETHSHTL